MGSGPADLQRDIGGAIMQSLVGALLTAGYRRSAAAAPNNQQIDDSVQNQLTKYAGQITAAARQSFLERDRWAYTAGLGAVLLGAGLVFFLLPKEEQEQRLLEEYEAEDTAQPEQRRLTLA